MCDGRAFASIAPTARWFTTAIREQFGRLVVAPLAKLLSQGPLAGLGPDAHEPRLTAKVLHDRIGHKKRPIKDVLMDQTVVAGLGNIQVTDALFRARLHPRARADSLTSADTVRLAKAIHTTLQKTLDMNKGDKIVYVEETKRVENPFPHLRKIGVALPALRSQSKKDGDLRPNQRVLLSMPEKAQAMTAAAIPNVPGFAIGQLLEFRNHRLDWLMRLQSEFGDICRARLGPFPTVLISSAEYAQSILVENAQHFVKSRGVRLTRPLLGNGLLTSEHDFHRRQRKLNLARLSAPPRVHLRRNHGRLC